MKTINLDASGWKTPLDFYDAILPALGAPEWHGRNLNALLESMVWGEINAVQQPYVVQIYSTNNVSQDLREHLMRIKNSLAEARQEFKSRKGHDVDVGFEIAHSSQSLKPEIRSSIHIEDDARSALR